MKKQQTYITVLDFLCTKVFQYKVNKPELFDDNCEDFLTQKGHNLSNCQWMIHSDPEIELN